MSKTLGSGELAELYLARNPGFENRVRIGDLFRVLRIPEGTALQQRVDDVIRRNKRPGRSATIRVWYENKRGAVRHAWYWCAPKDAKRVIAAYEAKRAATLAKRKAA